MYPEGPGGVLSVLGASGAVAFGIAAYLCLALVCAPRVVLILHCGTLLTTLSTAHFSPLRYLPVLPFRWLRATQRWPSPVAWPYLTGKAMNDTAFTRLPLAHVAKLWLRV